MCCPKKYDTHLRLRISRAKKICKHIVTHRFVICHLHIAAELLRVSAEVADWNTLPLHDPVAVTRPAVPLHDPVAVTRATLLQHDPLAVVSPASLQNSV